MLVTENQSLRRYNTFGLDVKCRYWVEITSVEEIQMLTKLAGFDPQNALILGGGSNILMKSDFKGWVIKNAINGFRVCQEDDKEVVVEVGAGVSWHKLVEVCVEEGYGGIENLSLIPGQVGAAPIQNIGAYGVELKDVFVSLHAVDMITGEEREFDHAQCQFGYRDSIFKREAKGKYLISSVKIRLQKNPVLNMNYGAIREELEKTGKKEFTIKDVSEAVIRIRQSKLPDPSEIGNAGSFFKNPEIPIALLNKIKEQYPDIVFYPISEDVVKIPAGWLIEKAGWKGKRFGNYGVHEKQALVLVNYGGASGQDLYDLSDKILADIFTKFGIELEREVNVIE